MLRCQSGQVRDGGESVVGTSRATVTGSQRHGETDGVKTQQRDSSRGVTFEPQGGNEPQPSTSYDHGSVAPASAVVRSPYTPKPNYEAPRRLA